MKEYSIGEIASLLGVSKEMVRYYERYGIITPIRYDNNYRKYSMMDYFALMEAVTLSRFDINIKDIAHITKNSFFTETPYRIRKFINSMGRKLFYNQLLIQRAETYTGRMETAMLNLDNYWVEKIPAALSFPFMNSINDEYEFVNSELNNYFNSPRLCPFMDSVITYKGDYQEWNLRIDENYADLLEAKIRQQAIKIPERYCMCTIIDMGEIGAFDSRKVYEKCMEHFNASGWKQDGYISGMMVGRGVENNKYYRLIKVTIPIKQ